MSKITMRPAKPSELGTVEDLLTEASVWLAQRGIDQWQFPPHRDRITHAIEHGECFIAEMDGTIIGTITLDAHPDPEFWVADDEPNDALYVHRMAVTRKAAGAGVGAVMLEWASKRAAEAGKGWLRLDAWRTNEGLHRYYTDQGFTLVRIVSLAHRGSGALFQRPT
ncbi:GNAT family N-acetyltransferase [Actinacidiphila acidipaludis]|uniref:GNAT family N-acetyltransferase n=1 Tax=Actinacidiphila acidipaludis TaxID=2873382 RepID=A0ABS7Q7I1_9ACTN|nr:GNAT family N-acetyltransferase [Streptomyces acidipaludis]MBY8879096.1 GNAT family N-acetyltransferase [Streptomyces acidipaludis]